ncbi:hypothetical protein NLI96_g1582 [Meripilus lineatus]|uniref:CTLH domain-containing protein n=1 Tax=Meripilus lineatus TaxID=2056292 RepID=A0AAD5VAK0_9APHY|nr:hypothetical protein NLI96_g1582 [Physisporinus lineatus]
MASSQVWVRYKPDIEDRMSNITKSAMNRGLCNPAPEELRALVLNYLCHNSFPNTARAFVRDTSVKHLDPDGDEMMIPERGSTDTLAATLEDRLTFAEQRKEIRAQILSGNVDEAITLLNSLFPQVLSEDPEDSQNKAPIPPNPDCVPYIPSSSIDATHLALNLRIQAFVEATRSVPLLYPPQPDDSSRTPLTQNLRNEEVCQAQLLHRAQSLYASVHCLTEAKDRALYLDELTQVSSLLVYPTPEDSPMASYLTQERREALASQIDSAILCRMNQPSLSIVELATRYTSFLWSSLHDRHVKPPHKSKWPTGVHLPPSSLQAFKAPETSADSNHHVHIKKSNSEKDSGEPVPEFNLSQFLNSTP